MKLLLKRLISPASPGIACLLKDINWEVKKGEHWVVFGMNGSGKTTLLSAVAGFKKYTHGNLKVFGEEYNQENILKFRQRIGWVAALFLIIIIPANQQ